MIERYRGDQQGDGVERVVRKDDRHDRKERQDADEELKGRGSDGRHREEARGQRDLVEQAAVLYDGRQCHRGRAREKVQERRGP